MGGLFNNKPTWHKADPARKQMWNGTVPLETNSNPPKKQRERKKKEGGIKAGL